MTQFHRRIVWPQRDKRFDVLRVAILGNRQMAVQFVVEQASGKFTGPLIYIGVKGAGVINPVERLIDAQLYFEAIGCLGKRNGLKIALQRLSGLTGSERVLRQQLFNALNGQRGIEAM